MPCDDPYFLGTGDISSGVALLEAVSREYESIIGMRDPALVALNKRAFSLFQTLSPEEKAKASPS